jgi:hypothetical protein
MPANEYLTFQIAPICNVDFHAVARGCSSDQFRGSNNLGEFFRLKENLGGPPAGRVKRENGDLGRRGWDMQDMHHSSDSLTYLSWERR